jgi:putative addiction module antidote
MTRELKLRKIGNSVGVILPKEVLERMKVGDGDVVQVTENSLGFQLTANNPEFEKTMAIFADLSKRYRNTLRELAK